MLTFPSPTMKLRWLLVTAFGLLSSHLMAAEQRAAQWLIVTAPAFRSAIEPLVEHRKAEGMKVQVIQTTDVVTFKEILNCNSQKLAEHVRKLCREHKGPSY